MEAQVVSDSGPDTSELPEGWVLQEIAAAVPIEQDHVTEEVRVLDWKTDDNARPPTGSCVVQMLTKSRSPEKRAAWVLATVSQYSADGDWGVDETGMIQMTEDGETFDVRDQHIRTFDHAPTEEEIRDFKRAFGW
jgi:hypothetical protein